MIQSFLIHTLSTYRYLILIPIGFAEGHIISLLSGFLARQGFLNPFLAGSCIATGNLLGDVVLYWLGYAKGGGFLLRHGKRFGVTEEKLAKVHDIYHSHKSSILLFSKLTNGFGLAVVILLTAGITKINFWKYMFWNFVGECIWTGGLVSVGYFFGSVYIQTGNIITKVGVIIGSAIFLVIAFLYFKNRLQKKINI